MMVGVAFNVADEMAKRFSVSRSHVHDARKSQSLLMLVMSILNQQPRTTASDVVTGSPRLGKAGLQHVMMTGGRKSCPNLTVPTEPISVLHRWRKIGHTNDAMIGEQTVSCQAPSIAMIARLGRSASAQLVPLATRSRIFAQL